MAVAVVMILIFKFLLEKSGKKRTRGEERERGERERAREGGGREGYVNYRGCVKRWAQDWIGGWLLVRLAEVRKRTS